ncbi:hypothetical protein EJA71_03720 [Pseudomonas sp. PB106]|nr:hypothetical protein EJA71_03720 [Pseudomonas sp. PB106]
MLTVTLPVAFIVFIFVIRRRTTWLRIFPRFSGNVNNKLYDDLVNLNFQLSAQPCGSWLASDCAVSFNKDAGCAGLFAGKPAPTGFGG